MPGGTISVVDYTKAENAAAPASTTGIYLSANATWRRGTSGSGAGRCRPWGRG